MIRRERSWLGIAAAGLAGAGALTLLQLWARENVKGSPRLDRVGSKLLSKSLKKVGLTPPRGKELERAALYSDLVTNSLFFGALVAGKRFGVLRRGLFWGAAAGLGAIVLAPKLGLSRRDVARDLKTKAMTVGMYTAGGLATAGASRVLAPVPF